MPGACSLGLNGRAPKPKGLSQAAQQSPWRQRFGSRNCSSCEGIEGRSWSIFPALRMWSGGIWLLSDMGLLLGGGRHQSRESPI